MYSILSLKPDVTKIWNVWTAPTVGISLLVLYKLTLHANHESKYEKMLIWKFIHMRYKGVQILNNHLKRKKKKVWTEI
jgi:hypothetical protein